MEQGRALQALVEAADLVRMLEDITNPSVLSSISAASMAGVRVTLKNVRESILASHDTLAAQVIHRARVHLDASLQTAASAADLGADNGGGVSETPVMSRRDLRASLEKLIEKGS
jgi:hypothetical protein